MPVRQHHEGAGRVREALRAARCPDRIGGLPAGVELQAARVQHRPHHRHLRRPLGDDDQVARLQQHIELRPRGEQDRIRLHHHPPGGLGLAQGARQFAPRRDQPAEIGPLAGPARIRLPRRDREQGGLDIPRRAGEAVLLAQPHRFTREDGAIGIGLRRQPARPLQQLRQAFPAADVVDAGPQHFPGQRDRPGFPIREAARDPHHIARRKAHGAEVAAAEVERRPGEGDRLPPFRWLPRHFHRREISAVRQAAGDGQQQVEAGVVLHRIEAGLLHLPRQQHRPVQQETEQRRVILEDRRAAGRADIGEAGAPCMGEARRRGSRGDGKHGQRRTCRLARRFAAQRALHWRAGQEGDVGLAEHQDLVALCEREVRRTAHHAREVEWHEAADPRRGVHPQHDAKPHIGVGPQQPGIGQQPAQRGAARRRPCQGCGDMAGQPQLVRHHIGARLHQHGIAAPDLVRGAQLGKGPAAGGIGALDQEAVAARPQRVPRQPQHGGQRDGGCAGRKLIDRGARHLARHGDHAAEGGDQDAFAFAQPDVGGAGFPRDDGVEIQHPRPLRPVDADGAERAGLPDAARLLQGVEHRG